MPLGIGCNRKEAKEAAHADISAKYDDSTPIKCKTCSSAYPAVNLNASIMLLYPLLFLQPLSSKLQTIKFATDFCIKRSKS